MFGNRPLKISISVRCVATGEVITPWWHPPKAGAVHRGDAMFLKEPLDTGMNWKEVMDNK
jgi:hypothetical protein